MMTFEVHPPDGEFGGRPWQRELVGFRSEVLRSFGLPSGLDHDVHDGPAHHLLARTPDGGLAGCARLAPLEDLNPSRVLTLEPRSADILTEAGLTAADVLEGGRWLVGAEHRHAGVGSRLVLAGAVVAVRLGRKLAWVLAGTAHGQDTLLMRMGFHAPSGRVHEMPDLGYPVRLLTVRPDRLLHGREEPEVVFL
ncbi:hypothetical protein [Herbidospora sp. NBRC 101105]|uniref:hypothetical protein n=1 Tax=Herbidospora sp. NBRC 101105 TaxID=3032195 RepID=UPI002554C740|nr:hypothetical protein [Herbidospora sp. NBRC 101105]